MRTLAKLMLIAFAALAAHSRQYDSPEFSQRAEHLTQKKSLAEHSLKYILNERDFAKLNIKRPRPKFPTLLHYVTYTRQGESLYPTVRVDRMDPAAERPLSDRDRVLQRFSTLREASSFSSSLTAIHPQPEATALRA